MVPWVPRGWCRVLWCLVLMCPVLAGCSGNTAASCDWPTDRNTTFQLLDDVRLAEDMAVRFADAQGYEPGWRATREACEATLFAGLATARGLTVGEVANARGQLDRRGFDWLVNVPMAALCLALGMAVTRRIATRFAGEAIPTVASVVLASIVMAVVMVVIGQVWAAFVEMIRIGNGHMSYRAARIPWSHHRPLTFALAVLTVWCVGAMQLVRRTEHPST
jgi:hypothetical protein